MSKQPKQPDTTLSESNYRDFAKAVIKAYHKKNMFIDALLWSTIVGYYEAALEKAGVK